jgi:hypothetical protein
MLVDDRFHLWWFLPLLLFDVGNAGLPFVLNVSVSSPHSSKLRQVKELTKMK